MRSLRVARVICHARCVRSVRSLWKTKPKEQPGYIVLIVANILRADSVACEQQTYGKR